MSSKNDREQLTSLVYSARDRSRAERSCSAWTSPRSFLFVPLAHLLRLASALLSCDWVGDSVYLCRRLVHSKETVTLAEFVEYGLFLLSVFCSRVSHMFLGAHHCVVNITVKRWLTEDLFDADAAAAVIVRSFLTALESLKMQRGIGRRCGALGVTVY